MDRVAGWQGGLPPTARMAYSQARMRLVQAGYQEEDAGRAARDLLAFCLDKDGLKLLLDFDDKLSQEEALGFIAAVGRLESHEPMAYITGKQDFGGLDIMVSPGVLIPRQDTMVLVEQALSRIREDEPVRILELGCGSGAVILALALARPLLQGLAVDVDPLAIRTAEENLRRFGVSQRIRLVQGSWFDEIDEHTTFDLILSNPPYISAAEMRGLPSSVKWEPEKALYGGQDGMDAYRAILPAAYQALAIDGCCLVEIGWKQGAAVRDVFAKAGFCKLEVFCDDGGRDRVVVGYRTGTRDSCMETKKTKYWKITYPGDPRLLEAGQMIRAGGLVAFPTETVYGLGANGLDDTAVGKIFTAKGRPADNPLILHVASLDGAKALAGNWDARAQSIAEKLWPGPLTMVVSAASHIPGNVRAGLDTVAIRYPSEPIALALIEAAGVPIAAPSANISGRPSPTKAEHVMEDLGGKIDLVIDGGPCKVGIESTIIDLSVDPPEILRPGSTTREALLSIVGEITDNERLMQADRSSSAPKAPGMKYRHYAPAAPVTILIGEPEAVAVYADRLMQGYSASAAALTGQGKPGFLLSEETWGMLHRDASQAIWADRMYYGCSMGSRAKPAEMGNRLYDALRESDKEGVGRIWAEACMVEGQGVAVMNRLIKASGGSMIRLRDNGEEWE